MNIGELIRTERKKQGLTQAELATKAGLSKNAIYNYENNKRIPTLAIINAIARALNIKPSTLAYGDLQNHSKSEEEIIKEIEDIVGPLESTDEMPEKYVNIAALFRSLGFDLSFYDEDEEKHFYLEPMKKIEGLLFNIKPVFLTEEELDKINTNVYDYTLFQAIQLYNSKVAELKKNMDE